MLKHRNLAARGLMALAALAAVGCSHGGSGDKIVLGAAGPWNEPYGDMNRKGMELALKQLKDAGKPVDIVFQNDSGSGVVATRVAQWFVDSSNAVAVIGHVSSGAMMSAARVYDGHMAAVATTASSPMLTGISKWTFRVISSDSANGVTIGQFASAHGMKRAALLYENTPYGRGLIDAFRRGFAGEIVSADPVEEGDTQSFEPYVSFYKSRHPDVVFMAGTGLSGTAFVKEARRQNLNAALMGGDGWTVLSSDTSLAEGIYVGAPFTAEQQDPRVQKFVQAFRDMFHLTPDGNAALGYDATMILAQAAEASNAHGIGDREKVRDYLADIKPGSEYQGVTGNIRFSSGGDPEAKGIVMTRITRGALAVVGDNK